MAKILFLVTEDWYFLSHRLALARAAMKAGAEVFVMTRLSAPSERLEREGFQVIPWRSIRRGSLSPLRDLAAMGEVLVAYHRLRPDLVHHIALKAVVQGGLAAQLCGGLPTVSTIAGLGLVFTGQSLMNSVLRTVLVSLLRFAMRGKNSRTIVQNVQNREILVQTGVIPDERAVLISGSGVDTDEFAPLPEPMGVPVVMLASRMIWIKGIGEFVEAAMISREKGIKARFVLVGDMDSENPSAVSLTQLRSWTDSEVVEWWGRKENMPNVLAEANIVCLPSHGGEGVPKVLIEAASCARAIVTTDIPGCKDIVRQGENGILIPVRNSTALADAIISLLNDSTLRARMGNRGRTIVLQEYTSTKVIEATFDVYSELLGNRWPEVCADKALEKAT